MDNRTALVLAVVLVAAAVADAVFNDADVLLFLARQIIRLSEWMAFWR
ncbi:MAG: glyceraldehyde-3-phosphate dehydrogenase [Rhodobacteraceae bacterium]|nr:glyceraldehyde-3-phosphate dehydrogenase [Paracoccaceae bacterium]